MDIDSIFGLFKPDKQSTKEILIDDYVFKVKMFSKLIIKGNVRKDLLVPLMKQIHPEYNIDDIRKEGEVMLYNRAFLYLCDFDENDESWLNAVNTCVDVFLITALQICIDYFKDIEEFEKCAVLYKVLIEGLKIFGIPKEDN
jgi:hypothetical protein